MVQFFWPTLYMVDAAMTTMMNDDLTDDKDPSVSK